MPIKCRIYGKKIVKSYGCCNMSDFQLKDKLGTAMKKNEVCSQYAKS